MTLAVGVLALGERPGPGGFEFPLLDVSIIPAENSGGGRLDAIFRVDSTLDRERWQGIVIHHIGAPSGDAESIHKLHQSFGWDGLGYHFVIGNGNQMEDGVVHVGYRWDRQLPGVHTAGPDADWYNRQTIGICLVGNGQRRPFTSKQNRAVASLVQALQRELDLPADRVWLHRDVASGALGPGQHFPEAQFRAQLLNRR
jgi:hypothetical protein